MLVGPGQTPPYAPLDVIAVVVRPREASDAVHALPLKHLSPAPDAPWAPLTEVLEPELAPPSGSVVRLTRTALGAVHAIHRYDDVIEALDGQWPAEALLNALWAVWLHGVREEWPHVRAARALGRLERHPDARVRSEALAAAGKL